MKQKLFVTLATLCALGLSACKSVDVDSNGAIANEYVSTLNNYEGSYAGSLLITRSNEIGTTSRIVSKNFKLTLNNVGNRPLLGSNLDILGAGCGSKIGKLLSLQVGGAWDFVAQFDFNPGACAELATGNYVTVYGNKNKALFVLKKDAYQTSLPGRTGTETLKYQSNLKKL